MSRKVDVVILGAGSAGLSAWKEVKKKTQSVIMINKGPYGTTCARVGCMPSKILIQVANDFHRRHKFSGVGINGSQELSVDLVKVMQHVRKLRDRFVGGVKKGGYTELGEDRNIQGHAKILSPNLVEVNGETIEAKSIIIGTGTKPIILKQWQSFASKVLTSDNFFELEKLPSSIAVMGMGVIGLELGQALSRLGVKVTLIGLDERVGGLSDPDVYKYALEGFKEEFPVWVGKKTDIEELPGGGFKVSCDDNSGEFEAVFAAIGRSPNIENLGLENLGVPLGGNGLPEFDLTTSQIGDLPVYIAGDINGYRPLLHEASDEGLIAGYNAVRDGVQCFKRRTPIAVTFSSPNLAVVGKSFAELEGTDFEVGTASYEGQGRALAMLNNRGVLKLYGDPKTCRLLGAEMIAPSGEHLAHLLAWAIQNEMKIPEILQMPFYHPVIEEGLRSALRDLNSKIASPCSEAELAMCGTESAEV